jgi:hypothetical protein
VLPLQALVLGLAIGRVEQRVVHDLGQVLEAVVEAADLKVVAPGLPAAAADQGGEAGGGDQERSHQGQGLGQKQAVFGKKRGHSKGPSGRWQWKSARRAGRIADVGAGQAALTEQSRRADVIWSGRRETVLATLQSSCL